jgi:protein-S-isoprenylcysteine O-methyltransferase Ste14
MDPLRIVLFLGLVLHKLLWEFLKVRDGRRELRSQVRGLMGQWLIKPLKLLVLMFFAVQTLFLDLFPIAEDPATLRMLGTMIYFAGLGTAVLGRVQLGKNWVDLEDYQVLPDQSLTTNGIYRYIRHPIYTGDILLLTGLELALNSWLVIGALVPLVVAVKHALAEEALLSHVFPGYAKYCRRTKRFIPFIV